MNDKRIIVPTDAIHKILIKTGWLQYRARQAKTRRKFANCFCAEIQLILGNLNCLYLSAVSRGEGGMNLIVNRRMHIPFYLNRPNSEIKQARGWAGSCPEPNTKGFLALSPRAPSGGPNGGDQPCPRPPRRSCGCWAKGGPG